MCVFFLLILRCKVTDFFSLQIYTFLRHKRNLCLSFFMIIPQCTANNDLYIKKDIAHRRYGGEGMEWLSETRHLIKPCKKNDRSHGWSFLPISDLEITFQMCSKGKHMAFGEPQSIAAVASFVPKGAPPPILFSCIPNPASCIFSPQDCSNARKGQAVWSAVCRRAPGRRRCLWRDLVSWRPLRDIRRNS